MTLWGDSEPENISNKLDPTYEAFAEHFRLAFDPLDYPSTKGDFVMLRRLRRTLNIGTRTTPVNWDIACRNYFLTPMGSYTLRDLCSRYYIFVRNPLDRFNKPIQYERQTSQERSNDEAARRVIERIVGEPREASGSATVRRTTTSISGSLTRLNRKSDNFNF